MVKQDNELNKLRWYRDENIKAGYLHAAFVYQAGLIKCYQKHPIITMGTSIIDHYTVRTLILKEIMGSIDEKISHYLQMDIIIALSTKRDKSFHQLISKANDIYATCPQYENIDSNIFCIYREAIFFSYNMMDLDSARLVVRNLFYLFEKRYGADNELFVRYALHLIYEAVLLKDMDDAYKLFLYYKDIFKKTLYNYLYFYESMLIFSESIAGKNSTEAEAILTELENSLLLEVCIEHKSYFRAKTFNIRGRIVENHTDYIEAIKYYRKAIKEICKESFETKDTINVPLNYINIASNLIRCLSYSGESGEALELCNNCLYVNSQYKLGIHYSYYQLLHFKGYLLMNNAEYSQASELFAEIIYSGKQYIGKDNEIYILALINKHVIDIQNAGFTNAERSLLEEALELSLKIDDANCLSLVYNHMSLYGSYTIDWEEAEQYARLAIVYEEKTHRQNQLFTYGCILLNNLIHQLHKRPSLKQEVIKLYQKLKNELLQMYDQPFKEQYLFFTCETFYEVYLGNYDIAIDMIHQYTDLLTEDYPVERFNLGIDLVKILIVAGRENEALQELHYLCEFSLEYIASDSNIDIYDILLPEIAINYYITILLKSHENHKEMEIFRLITLSKTLKTILLRHRNGVQGANKETAILYRKLAAYETRIGLKVDFKNNEKGKLQREIDSIYQQLAGSKRRNSSNYNSIEFSENFYISMPDNALLIEAYTYMDFDMTPFANYNEQTLIEKMKIVFFIGKQNDRKENNLEYIQYGEADLEYISDLVDEFSEEVTREGKVVQYQKELYGLLIQPLERFLQEGTTIYVSASSVLMQVPFEILLDNTHSLLGDRYQIIYLESGKYVNGDFNVDFKRNSSLIIGNPSYGARYYKEIDDLPHSELEATTISKILGTESYVGERAVKELLLGQLNHSVIHISSHGNILDMMDENENIQSQLVGSHILLAGYEDWIHDGTHANNSNGLLSAEEITYMDFSQVDLVVLSACDTAIGLYLDMNVTKGLRWALNVAGAKVSITSLWEVDDCATAIFMVMLYRNLLNHSIALALRVTKTQFRLLTIEKIMCDEQLNRIYTYQSNPIGNLSLKPYHHIKYWAAFVCYFNERK